MTSCLSVSLRGSRRTATGGWVVRLTEAPLDLDNPAHLDALRRAYERFPEIGGRSTPRGSTRLAMAVLERDCQASQVVPDGIRTRGRGDRKPQAGRAVTRYHLDSPRVRHPAPSHAIPPCAASNPAGGGTCAPLPRLRPSPRWVVCGWRGAACSPVPGFCPLAPLPPWSPPQARTAAAMCRSPRVLLSGRACILRTALPGLFRS
ncbi:hypothetical protein F0U62_35660 [Cystobacter fuscus]|uniref:DUF5953 family protein n=1 Tax=Cystobacter fuscus TaxID=43 RepID=UPI002B294BF7|nr:hypothetical protein F0U62_35660 [Cystobacter fuscus]